jgi:SAM-dependent methyltransferase
MDGQNPVIHLRDQDRQWSRKAALYDELFLDAFDPGVESPLMAALEAIPEPSAKTVADLGCGTGPLLPYLAAKFARVIAIDFAPAMLQRARKRFAGNGEVVNIDFRNRPMHELDDLEGALDVAVAVNSLVMPDVRAIDRTLRAVRKALRPEGVFLGVVPSMDAIHYHTMLLHDQALDRGAAPAEAQRYAAHHAEHSLYDFAFGRFRFQGIEQKFWQPFEVRHRLTKAGFRSVELDQLLYPWDESLARGPDFAEYPKSWDWSFVARP